MCLPLASSKLCSDKLHLELAEVWQRRWGLRHVAVRSTGLVARYCPRADSGAELLQGHEHLLLETLLLLLLAFQPTLALQHQVYSLCKFLDLIVHRVQFFCKRLRAGGRTPCNSNLISPLRVVMGCRVGGTQYGCLSTDFFRLEETQERLSNKCRNMAILFHNHRISLSWNE